VRNLWPGLQESFSTQLLSLPINQAFRRARKRFPSLTRFDDPAAVVAYLRGPEGDLDEKDRIFTDAVTMVQWLEEADLGATLLWCGLWPGLDARFRALLTEFRDDPDEIASDVQVAFTFLAARLNLPRVARVAGTLVLSTERDVRYRRKKLRRRESRFVRLDDVDEPAVEDGGFSSALDIDPILPFDEQVALLRERVAVFAGPDTDLVMEVFVLGMRACDVAELHGLKPAAVRQRLCRLRPELARLCPDYASHLGG
jgi:hypothetical protein